MTITYTFLFLSIHSCWQEVSLLFKKRERRKHTGDHQLIRMGWRCRIIQRNPTVKTLQTNPRNRLGGDAEKES
jgi:hypothetical protein